MLQLEVQLKQVKEDCAEEVSRLNKLVDNFGEESSVSEKLVDNYEVQRSHFDKLVDRLRTDLEEVRSQLEQSAAERNSFMDSAQTWQDIADRNQELKEECEAQRGALDVEVANLAEQLEQLRSQLAEGELATSEADSQQVQLDFSRPISGRKLEQRLNVGHATLLRRKVMPDFPDWSKERDPEGLAWRYDARVKKIFQCSTL